ncbi:ABC transporter permease subunit [Microbacterium sp. SYP-A9085]|jgi:iron(III) transport system permease protein|uniref:ABC transporter permease n=1 Tax=Microbacterium sp. SYP-A9085 TaxID=2664454 RepID=UPI00129AE8BD|nr:iron ABC transporter permease [Microbacterium sp. SYP-A9085]MRH27760.1 ABC transporter permease subunit [Microbacterium sp. SYP-A9085]
MTLLDRPGVAPGEPGGSATEIVALPPGGARRTRLRAPSALAIVILLLLLGLVAGPVLMVFVGAVQSEAPGLPNNHFSWDAVFRVYFSGDFYGSLLGTLGMAIATAALSVVFGGIAAWFLTRVAVPLRRLWEFGLILPLFLSPFVGALAWLLLAAPNSGIINVNLRWMLGLDDDTVLVNIMTLPGVVFVMLLFYVPYAYLFISSALRNMDPSLEEASSMNGRGTFATAMRVTLPMMRPAIVASFFFVAVLATGVFVIPAVLGLNTSFSPLAVEVYRAMTVFPSNPPTAAALGTLLFWFTLVGVYLYRRSVRNANRYVTLSARATRPRAVALPVGRWVAAAFFAVYALLAAVLPYLTLILMSLTPFAITDLRNIKLSLSGITQVWTRPDVATAFGNTLVLGIVVPTVVVLIGLGVAYVVVRERGRLGALIDYLGTFPIAVPGIVFATGVLWLYVRTPVYATVFVVTIALIGAYMPHGARFASAGLIQIDRSLEEAARMNGASKLRMLFTVTFPLLRPSLLSAWTLLFVFATREVNEAVILSGPKSRPLSVLAWNYVEQGSLQQAAVVGLFLTVVMAVGILFARVVLRAKLDSSNL